MQKYLEVKFLYNIELKTREVENCWVFDQDLHIFHGTIMLMQFVQSLCLVLVKPSTFACCPIICLVCKRSASCTYNIKGLTSQHITTPKSLASETKQRALVSFSCRRSWPGMSWSAQNFIRISSWKFYLSGRIYWSCWTTPSASSTWRWDPSLFDFFATSSAVIPREFFCSFLAPRAKMATTNRGFPSCTAKWRG